MKRAETIHGDTSTLELYNICINIAYCEGYSKKGPYVFKYEKIHFNQFINDTEWSTVLPLKLGQLNDRRTIGNFILLELQIFYSHQVVDLNRCCPPTNDSLNLNLGRREVKVQVRIYISIIIIFSCL